MDLLKDHDLDFRYWLRTDDQDNIYISFGYFEKGITKTEQTVLESTYNVNMIINRAEVDENQSKTDSITLNDVTTAKFYKTVENYIKERGRTNKLGVKSIDTIKVATCNHAGFDRIVFTPEIFAAMASAAKNIEFNISECGFRVTGEPEQIDFLKVIDGTILVDEGATLNSKRIFLQKCKIDTFNKSSSNVLINIKTDERFDAISLSVYSTVKVNLFVNSSDYNSYDKSKCLVSYYEIFGEETTEEDKNEPRLTVRGFKKCNITRLLAKPEVQYGTLLSVDNMMSLTLGGLERKVKNIFDGNMIVVGDVANVSLYKLDIVITKDHSLKPEYSIVNFIKTKNTSLYRKLKIFDSDIDTTNLDGTIYLCKLRGVEMDKVLVSDCRIRKGVEMFDMDSSVKFRKIVLASTALESENRIHLVNSTSIKISDCELTTKDVRLNGERLSINRSKLYFDGLTVDNTKIPVNKFSTIESRFEGSRITIKNSSLEKDEVCPTWYDTKSFFTLKNIDVDMFNVNLQYSYLDVNDIVISGDGINRFIDCYNVMRHKDFTIKSNGSIMYSSILVNDSDDINRLKILFDINDTVEALSTERISIINPASEKGSPSAHVTTNNAAHAEFTGFTKSNQVHMKLSDDYSSSGAVRVVVKTMEGQTEDDMPVVLNDSESISVIKCEDLTDSEGKMYTLKRK